MVYRVFVEKKPGLDVQAARLTEDLRAHLGLLRLSNTRVFKRYDVEGLAAAKFAVACREIFAEPNLDDLHDVLPRMDARLLMMSYLPGQYDQRADSAAQCAQLLFGGERPVVKCAVVYAFFGSLTDAEYARARDYLLNPVESCEVTGELPATLDDPVTDPGRVPVVEGFTSMSDDAVRAMCAELGMAMTPDDLLFVRAYFRDQEGRDPTQTELRVIDTYWSDHCRHTTFLTRLERVSFEKHPLTAPVESAWKRYLSARDTLKAKRDVSLMDIALTGMKELKRQGKLHDLDESEEINACSINVRAMVDGRPEDWLVMFKNETHNHPTEIEPFGGAATCLGGAIRDPLSGRSYVYQAMRVTGAGDARVPIEETLPGKLPQRRITTGAMEGYSSYGNQIGLPTGKVHEFVHPGYVAKRMELGAVIGAARKDAVRREAPAPGDVILLVGGRTGRDGCGGATGSSKAHTGDSILTCGAEVQKGNPPTERMLQRLFRNREAALLIKRCNDFGAGGVCVAVGELAESLDIDLDAVPRKYEGLSGTELAISESQERMAVVVAEKDAARFKELSNMENLECTRVAVVTDTGRMRMSWRKDAIVDVSRDFLNTNGVTQTADARVLAPKGDMPRTAQKTWAEALSHPSACAQRGLQERFDGTIGAGTVLHPHGGATQRTPVEAMAAKLPVSGETTTCTLMSFGFDPYLSSWSPFHGASFAVVESLYKILAAGGDPLTARMSFQEFFERLRDEPERWGKPLAALLGGLDAQLSLGVPAIGGKDSMSGSFGDMDVPPTLVAFAVAAADTGAVVSPELKKACRELVFAKLPLTDALTPDYPALIAQFQAVRALYANGAVAAAHTVFAGGLAAALGKMAVGNEIGVALKDSVDPFASDRGLLMELIEGTSVPAGFRVVGRTMAEKAIAHKGVSIPLDEIAAMLDGTFERVFPTKSHALSHESAPTLSHPSARTHRAAVKIARPRVIIPFFPGSNCELDSARAFRMAGAEATALMVRNVTPSALKESIDALEAAIRASQILMVPGGFSAGDEPDGSGKFIAIALRSPRVRDAIMELIKNRDGLVLGVCNGFQALIKTGLVPYGEIREPSPDAPTLTFNRIGYIARYVRTRVASTVSPWLARCAVGDIHAIPVAHGEGRVVISHAELEGLVARGQIATQYVDDEGNATMREPFNPNGSMCAIEGMTSPDGRVFGKMGHSERQGERVSINIAGEKDQHIFKAGVDYYA